MCLCMTSDEGIAVELLINSTVSRNCEWRLRISRHGIGFQQIFPGDDDASSDPVPVRAASDGITVLHPMHFSTSDSQHRIATLSVSDTEQPRLVLRWTHHLWHPSSTWLVYGGNISKDDDRIIQSQAPSRKASPTNNVTVQSKLELHRERELIRVGRKLVYALETKADDIEQIYKQEQKAHCVQLYQRLIAIVQKDLINSLRILDNFHYVVEQIEMKLAQNPSVFRVDTFPTLMSNWLLLSSSRWEQRIQRLMRKRRADKLLPCAPSFTYPLDSPYHLASGRSEFAKIYHDLFLSAQHLASWTSNERHNWLRRPRVTSFIRHLQTRLPPVDELRQAVHKMLRYFRLLPNSNSMSLMSDLTFHSRIKGMFANKSLIAPILKRGAVLKFEELRFWPPPSKRSAHIHTTDATVSADVINLRRELLQLTTDSDCFSWFIGYWQKLREKEAPSSCQIRNFTPQNFDIGRQAHSLKVSL
ncbi:unnamed protein product [Dicrocoelium dendriticum]|nr:unnamed protein product [Dicrocoelium dendriticum]